MRTLLNIGNEVTKNDITIKASADAIAKIFEAGAKHHTEQETIRCAIQALGQLTPVKNVTLSDCKFSANAAVGVMEGDKDDK